MSDRLRRLVADLEAEAPTNGTRRNPSAYYQPSFATLPPSSSAASTNNGFKPFRFAETSQQLNRLPGDPTSVGTASLRQLPPLSTSRSAQPDRHTPPSMIPPSNTVTSASYQPTLNLTAPTTQQHVSPPSTHAQPVPAWTVHQRAGPSEQDAGRGVRAGSDDLQHLHNESAQLRTELQQARAAAAAAEKHAQHLKEQLTRKYGEAAFRVT
jgi:hypothetical protein